MIISKQKFRISNLRCLETYVLKFVNLKIDYLSIDKLIWVKNRIIRLLFQPEFTIHPQPD